MIRNFKIYENVEQAKSYLKSKNILEDDKIYKEIRRLLNGKDGYVGWLTKLTYDNIRPNYNNENQVIAEVERIVDNIIKNPNILDNLSKSLIKYDNYEKLLDDCEIALRKYKSKRIYNEFPSEQKRLIDINDNNIINLLSKLYDDDSKKIFLTKISAYKDKKSLITSIERFVSDKTDNDFNKKVNYLQKNGLEIIYANDDNDTIVARMFNYDQCKKVSSKTSWCIVRSESTFKSYVKGLNRQYIIYLLDLSNDDRIIGVTYSVSGYKTAHNVTDGYVSKDKLNKLLSERGFDINKLKIPKEGLTQKDINNATIQQLKTLGFDMDEILSKKNKFVPADYSHFTEKQLKEYGIKDKLNYDELSFDELKNLGFSIDGILQNKTNLAWHEIRKITKEEIESNISNFNYIPVNDLFDKGFTREEVLENKTKYSVEDTTRFKKETIIEYDLLNKFDKIHGKVLRLYTKEEILELGLLNRIGKNSLSFDMLFEKGFKREDIENLDNFVDLLDNENIKLYTNYLSKNKDDFKKITDYRFGETYVSSRNEDKEDKYDAGKTIDIMMWCGIDPEKFPLETIPEVLRDCWESNFGKVINLLKDNGYTWTNNELISFFKKIKYTGSFDNNDIKLYSELIKNGVDVKKEFVNYLIRKDDKGNLSFFTSRTVYEHDIEKAVEVLKDDYPKEAELVKSFNKRNIFLEKTLMTAKHKGDKGLRKDWITTEDWYKEWGVYGASLEWDSMKYNLYGNNYSGLISYIILMTLNNQFDYLYSIKYNWDSGKNNRGWSDGTFLEQLVGVIVGTNITNHSATYEVEPELNDDQRYKLYEWLTNYVWPKINDKSFFSHDMQLIYLIYDRIKLNKYIDSLNNIKDNDYEHDDNDEKVYYNLRIKKLKPLFEYLLRVSYYEDTFFYKSERFDNILDIKYYLNRFNDYVKIDDKERERTSEYLLNLTNDRNKGKPTYEKFVEIVKELFGKKEEEVRSGVMGRRLVTNESVIKDYNEYILKKGNH
jgi:hypothetical protein